jgi:hypothetical protein
VDVGSLTAGDFAGRLQQVFRIRLDGGGWLEVHLAEVAEAPDRAAPGARMRRPFSILFRGPPGPSLPQRIYRLEHAEMGALELFLVPLGPDAEGTRYEAVFG